MATRYNVARRSLRETHMLFSVFYPLTSDFQTSV